MKYLCLCCMWTGDKAEMGYCPECGRDCLKVVEE